MKASIVTLTPLFSFSLLSWTRKASSSVMSASSWLVTCGIITQLRCRLAPLIFLMRLRSLRSTGPNLAKSTCGQASRPGKAAAGGGRGGAGAFAFCAAVCTLPAMTPLTKPCRSSWVMRPLGPLPFTSASGTPSSRARRRIEGEACGNCAVGAAVGSWATRPARRCRHRRHRGAGAAAGTACAAGAAAGPGRQPPRRAAPVSRTTGVPIDHLVADGHQHLLDHAGVRRRDLHRRLVALDGDQALLDLDGVAGLDEDLDHRDLVEVADVGHEHRDRTAARRGSRRRRRRGRRGRCRRGRWRRSGCRRRRRGAPRRFPAPAPPSPG